MSETNMNNIAAVQELNKVEGFDPSVFLRRFQEVDNNGTPVERFYLDVAIRKLWFRLAHPAGAIRKFVREITDQFAIVEAKVYLDRNDPPDSYIANAIVKRYFNPEDKFGDKYLELAETAAVGRALADAGFGIQFTDNTDAADPSVVDTPVQMPKGGQTSTITDEVMQPPQPTNGIPAMMQNMPGKGYVPAQGMPNNGTVPSYGQQPGNMEQRQQPAPAPVQMPQFTQDMPVEAILPQMTLEYATQYVVNTGSYAGKSLGQLAMEKPGSLDWYVNSYKGKNNILRAAAKFLLDQAAAG